MGILFVKTLAFSVLAIHILHKTVPIYYTTSIDTETTVLTVSISVNMELMSIQFRSGCKHLT